MKKIFENPEVEVIEFEKKSSILTESNENDDIWSPDII